MWVDFFARSVSTTNYPLFAVMMRAMTDHALLDGVIAKFEEDFND
jgi:hypothetical protein